VTQPQGPEPPDEPLGKESKGSGFVVAVVLVLVAIGFL
jgi:hypothetical protein